MPQKHPFLIGLTTALLVVITWRWVVEFSSPTLSLSVPSHSFCSQFDIVLSHYSEDPGEVRNGVEVIKQIPAIAELNPRVIVYTKGPIGSSPDADMKLEALRQSLGADIIRELPNQGRESDTYLTHIIDHYDDLADHTFFAQAIIHNDYGTDLDAISQRLNVHFNKTVGVMSLGIHFSCQYDTCTHTWAPTRGFIRIPQLYAIFNQDFCPSEGFLLSFRAQIIVSRNRILRNSRDKFQWLRQTLTNMSHFVHEDNCPDDPDWYDSKAVDNPIFGHTLERSWLFIFGCNDLSILTECETLDFQGASSRCACYDM